MRIEENRVYMFTFDTGEMGHLQIPVRGENKEQAVDALQRLLGRIQSELSMEFPRISPDVIAPGAAEQVSAAGIGIVPAEVLELRIDTLLSDMGGASLTDAGKAETIKNWTKLAFKPENYPSIITELELIASGQKEVEPAAPVSVPKEKKK